MKGRRRKPTPNSNALAALLYSFHYGFTWPTFGLSNSNELTRRGVSADFEGITLLMWCFLGGHIRLL